MNAKSQLSYVHGANSTPLIGKTIGCFFEEACQRWPDRPALIVSHQSVRLTYSELRDKVDRVAAGLLAIGLQPGDRIGIWSQNNSEWIVTQFAAAKAGLILVNINPAYRANELEYVLNKVKCKALILMERFKTSDFVAVLRELAPEIEHSSFGYLRTNRLPHLRSVVLIGNNLLPGMIYFEKLLDLGGVPEISQLEDLSFKMDFDTAVNIQFTSGTTGFPKAATLSHLDALNNGFFIGEAIRLTTDDRVCIPLPMYHAFGMVMGNLACITHGAAMVLPSEAFDPLETLRTIAKERCTAVYGVPTMFIAMLDHPEFDNFDLSSLRTGIMGGSPCPIEVMRKVISSMNLREITIAYGMTETMVSFQSSTEDPIERRVTTVGRIHPHLEVKIVDAEGRIVPRGTPGELLARGYSVMLGYWGDEEKTKESIDSARWMHSGDLATIDEEGYCNIVGRIKDMVIRGGENIYPREIEEFLYRHPGIQDVQIIGVPDEWYGEELCAWIKLKDGVHTSDEEIREFCLGKMAKYKVPRYIKFTDSFPMTVTGKIQKSVMRERMITELGLKIVKTA